MEALLMGHRKFHAPKHGSLAFLPRGRTKRIWGRIRNWPEYSGEPTILGFAGYKAGMTHVVIVDNTPHSPYYGQEVIKAATVIEAPPLFVFGIRGYKQTHTGLRLLSEVWASEYPRDADRLLTLPKNYNLEDKLNAFLSLKDNFSKITLMLLTQPRSAGVHKKKPELLEYPVGAKSIDDALNFATQYLGQTITVDKVLNEGQYIDVIAVTKGLGFQGPVKRWGIRILQHKSRKTKRGVGSINPWHPNRVMYSVPRAGQMGFFQRTEYNKLIVKIGSVGKEITPAGGFPHYGVVKSNYVLLLGSVPGKPTRLIRLRYPIRPYRYTLEKPPEIKYIHITSSNVVTRNE